MVTLGSAWVVFCFLVCSQAYVNVTRCPAGLTPTGDWSKTTFLQHFFLAEIRPLRPAKQQTTVHMCYTDSHLMLRFDCIDDNPYSSYTQCNDPLFKQDVVEVFITATSPHLSKINLHHYLELEVSPNSVLFASHIYNPNLDCPGISGTPIPCSSGAIQWEAQKNLRENTWWAFLGISWEVINSNAVESSESSGVTPAFFGANFFRIDTPLGSTKEYSAWKSPESKSVPCFHAPAAFTDFAVPR